MQTLFSFLIFLLFLLYTPVVSAEENPVPSVDFSALLETAVVVQKDRSGNPHPVVARLIVDTEKVQEGVPFRLGVHLTMEEEWHTYWRSPGGVGKRTEIEWSVPDGTQTSEYVFPIPHRYFDGASVSYGYGDQILLFTDVVLPPTATGTIDLTASVRWLVCKTSCIMGRAELSTPVEVGTASSPSSFAPLFDHFADQHPTPLSSVEGVEVTYDFSVSKLHSEESFVFGIAIQAKEGVELRVGIEEGQGSWPYVTPILEGTFDAEFDEGGVLPQVLMSKSTDGRLFVRIPAVAFEIYDEDPLPEGEQIGSLLQLEIDGKKVWTEVVAPVLWEKGEASAQYTSNLLAQAEEAPVFVPPVVQRSSENKKEESKEPIPKESKNPAPEESKSKLLMLGFAFLGGLILNVMPCVLPVLTFKIYSMVEQQNQTAAKRQLSGLVYSAGVIVSFITIALVVIFSQQLFGHEVRWGFQNQSPVFTMTLGTICFLFGLSLFGVFEVPAFGASEMDKASAKDGLLGYFLTGVFTTLIATPCSAPFLGTGMAFAFELPPIEVVVFFVAAGLGLASPFLLAAFVPGASKLLPQPGAWMERFKQFMGFTLIGTTVWLISGMPSLIGSDGVTGYLAFLVIVGLGAWLLGTYGGATASSQRQVSVLGSVVVLLFAGGWYFLETPDLQAESEGELRRDTLIYQWKAGDTILQEGAEASLDVTKIPKDTKTVFVQLFNELTFTEEIPWQTFSEEGIDNLVGSEYTIFIDFTADWCASCKVNELNILETEAVRTAMEKHKVWPMKADNTKYSPLIDRWLKHFKSAGVPLYLVIPVKREAGFDRYESSVINLGEFITPSKVIEAIERASQK